MCNQQRVLNSVFFIGIVFIVGCGSGGGSGAAAGGGTPSTPTPTVTYQTAYLPALETNANYGYALSGVASLHRLTSDTDQSADLALGSYYGTKVGLYLGGSGKTFNTTTPSSNVPDVLITGGTSGFGSSLANVADLNGDNYRDLVIGSSQENKVFIFLGRSSWSGTLSSASADCIISAGSIFSGTDFGTAVGDAAEILSGGGVIIGAPNYGTGQGLVAVIPSATIATCASGSKNLTMSESLANSYYIREATAASTYFGSSVRTFNDGANSGLFVGASGASSAHGAVLVYATTLFTGAGGGGSTLLTYASATTMTPSDGLSSEQWGIGLPAVVSAASGSSRMLPALGITANTYLHHYGTATWGDGVKLKATVSGSDRVFGLFVVGNLLPKVDSSSSLRRLNYLDTGTADLVFGALVSGVPQLYLFSSADLLTTGAASQDIVTAAQYSLSLTVPVSLPAISGTVSFGSNPMPVADMTGNGSAELVFGVVDIPNFNSYDGFVVLLYR